MVYNNAWKFKTHKKKATGKKWFIIKSAEADTHRNLHDENIGREKRESNQFKK